MWQSAAMWAPLVAIVALAFATEAALGFGATVITVSAGQIFLPIDVILPAFVPLNLVLSAVLIARGLRDIDGALLLKRILPWMAIGMPIGMFGFRAIDATLARRVFGGAVVLLAISEITRLWRGKEASPPPRGVAQILLAIAGILHGAFATGGPLVVYVLGKSAGDKAKMRATLSVLWLVLNVAVLVGFIADGRVGAASGTGSLWLAGGLVIGIWLGEHVFRRFSETAFRRAVFGMLLAAGVLLLVRR